MTTQITQTPETINFEDVVVVEVPAPSKKNRTDKTKEKKKKKNDIQFKLTSFFKKK